MRNTKSKKQLILVYAQVHGLERAGARDIRAIEADLRGKLGAEHQTSLSYIAKVLRESGARVDFDDPYVNLRMDEPYASRLKGLLQFGDLEKAESSLRKLDEAYREYRSTSDRVGTHLVRSMVIRGKQRSRIIARDARVKVEKRREKEEIAAWFKVWLELPYSFFDWLELRKRSDEFQQMLSSYDSMSHLHNRKH